MALTTTAVNACDAGVWLDDDTGTPRDISGSTNSVTMNFEMDLGALEAFGTRWRTRLDCTKDASFDFTLIYSTAPNEALDILKNWFFAAVPGDRSCSIYIPDKNVGSDHYSFEARLENWSVPATAATGDPIAVSMTLRPNGEVEWTTATT
jgi:hypothetical protein